MFIGRESPSKTRRNSDWCLAKRPGKAARLSRRRPRYPCTRLQVFLILTGHGRIRPGNPSPYPGKQKKSAPRSCPGYATSWACRKNRFRPVAFSAKNPKTLNADDKPAGYPPRYTINPTGISGGSRPDRIRPTPTRGQEFRRDKETAPDARLLLSGG